LSVTRKTALPRFFGTDLSSRGEQRAEAVPPEPDCLVADPDIALMQQVFDVPQREPELNVRHDRQADDLGAAVEVFEWVASRRGQTLRGNLPVAAPRPEEQY
jgi:hypothetical protein